MPKLSDGGKLDLEKAREANGEWWSKLCYMHSEEILVKYVTLYIC